MTTLVTVDATDPTTPSVVVVLATQDGEHVTRQEYVLRKGTIHTFPLGTGTTLSVVESLVQVLE